MPGSTRRPVQSEKEEDMQNVTQTRDLWSYRDRSELGSNVVDTHADISGFSVEAVDTILEIGDAEVGVVGTKGFVGGFPRAEIPDFGEA